MDIYSFAPRRSGRRLGVILSGLAIGFVLLTAGGAPSTAKADSLFSFCNNVWLAPYGSPGYGCDGETAWAAPYAELYVWTNERAGCVRAIGYYGEAITGWTCVPNNSKGGTGLLPPGGTYRGSIRNNNVNYGGRFSGTTLCC